MVILALVTEAIICSVLQVDAVVIPNYSMYFIYYYSCFLFAYLIIKRRKFIHQFI